MSGLASETTGPIVLRHGFVKVTGCSIKCDVLTRKLPASPSRKPGEPDYADCTVIDVPVEVPDGKYIVYFDGHTAPVTKQRGVWLLRGAVKRYRQPTLVMESAVRQGQDRPHFLKS